jgi:hypothetical protein
VPMWASVVSSRMAQLTSHRTRRRWSHAMSVSVTHEGVAPASLAQLPGRIWQLLPFSFLLFSFFLPSFSSIHWRPAPLAISSSLPKSEPLVREIDSMSWYPNHVGYICHLYHLILLYFEIFIWMNSCGRD